MKACCGFGHRNVFENISGKLDKAVEEVITQGCEIFYTGAMGEFDRLFSSAVRKAKKIYPHIKLICVKPYFTAALHFNADKGVSFRTYAAAVIRNHLKKVMFTKKIAEYPLESIDDSPMLSYEMESSVEYCEMVDFIRHSSNAKDKGRSLSYRILTDKVFRHQPMTVIADRYHLKKSAAYRRLNEARGDFYRSYLMNREQALSA